MRKNELNDLEQTAIKVREHIIRMSGKGGCFIGASLSCADIIVYLYKKFLNINSENFNTPDRDYFFLSKGHDVPALYGTFVELNWMNKKKLEKHCSVDDDVYWHPNRKIPGIEFHSGSLGHLLSVASGVAIDCKLKKSKNKIVVMLGDGELNEGSVWESLLVASAYQLDNLLLIIDRNNFQANLGTEDLIPLEPLGKKFEAFNCTVNSVNGHDYNDLENVLKKFPFERNKISVVIAVSKRGKGLPSIEEKADRWFCNFTQEEVDSLIDELHGQTRASLKPDTLMVR